MQRSQDLRYALGRVRWRDLAVFASGYAIVVATGLLQHLRAAVVYLDAHLLAAPIGGFPEAFEHSHMQSAVGARQPVQLCDDGVRVNVLGHPAPLRSLLVYRPNILRHQGLCKRSCAPPVAGRASALPGSSSTV